MIGSQSIVELGNVTSVKTVSSRGFTPEELAEQALDKIIYVGSNCHPRYTRAGRGFQKSNSWCVSRVYETSYSI